MFAYPQERFLQRDSFVHRLDPRTKLLVTLMVLVAIGLLPFGKWGAYLFIWLLIVAVSQAAKIEIGRFLRSSFVALPFAMAALTLPFTVPGEVVAYLPIVNWPITLEGLVRAGSIIIKSWISVQAAILLVMTCPPADLFWALRSLHLPPILISIVSFMYRYLGTLADEAGRLLRARASRSAARTGARAGGTLMWRGRAAGYMVGSLMLRSFERSERIYNAMAARGYRGEMKQIERHHFGQRDVVVLSASALLLVVMVVWARL